MDFGKCDRKREFLFALESTEGELTEQTVLNYLAFCAGLAGAGKTLLFAHDGKKFFVTIDVKSAQQIGQRDRASSGAAQQTNQGAA